MKLLTNKEGIETLQLTNPFTLRQYLRQYRAEKCERCDKIKHEVFNPIRDCIEMIGHVPVPCKWDIGQYER